MMNTPRLMLAAASSVSQNLLQDVFGACTDGTAYADFCSAFFHCHHHDIRYTDGACQQGTQTYHPDQNPDTSHQIATKYEMKFRVGGQALTRPFRNAKLIPSQ